MKSPEAVAAAKKTPQIPLLLATVLAVYIGQASLNPVIAPLARELALAEWQLGLTISVAALMVVLTSQAWGRRTGSWGFRPVLITALSLAVVTTVLFTGLAAAGLRGLIGGTVLVVLFVFLRGVAFGTAIAAVPPTAQAYIAAATKEGPERVKGMAGIGAVHGIAAVAGAIIGGALAGFGLLVPLAMVPALITVGLVLVLFRLRPSAGSQQREAPAPISPADARIWPFLAAGFGIMTAMGFIQVTVGFIVQDRLHLGAEQTGQTTGIVMLAMGIGMIVAQAVVVPRSNLGPAALLRFGALLAALGFAICLPNHGVVLLAIGTGIVGLGIGTAMPGYTAGATMLVNPAAQGGLAGLIGATNGLTYVAAPTLSTLFYGWWHPMPILVSMVSVALVALFVSMQPIFRSPHLATKPTR